MYLLPDIDPIQINPSWWLNHPFEKYARQNGSIFSNFRGEKKKYLKPPPSLDPKYYMGVSKNMGENPPKWMVDYNGSKPY